MPSRPGYLLIFAKVFPGISDKMNGLLLPKCWSGRILAVEKTLEKAKKPLTTLVGSVTLRAVLQFF
jgi:hypothetical protein